MDEVINMKRILVMILVLSIVLCGCGKVSGAKLEIGESAIYSRAEIQAAMNVVKNHFRQGFEGCTLLNIRYDEEESRSAALDWAEQYNAKEAIVLYSDFLVIGNRNPTLNGNSKYENWSWVLVRNPFGSWELKTSGYG